jgi:hypothetical protein
MRAASPSSRRATSTAQMLHNGCIIVSMLAQSYLMPHLTPSLRPRQHHRYYGFNRGEKDGAKGLWYREWAPGARVSGVPACPV